MSNILDNWFIQKDVIDRIDNHNEYSDEYTLIYEAIDNTLEHFIYYTIPIPEKRISLRMEYETWGEDTFLTKKRVLLLKYSHFLSLSFRRYFNLNLYSKSYYSDSNKVFGKMDFDENLWQKKRRCYILTEALLEYLKVTKQNLLFGIRSHRYSERNLDEFNLKSVGEKYRTPLKNYSFHVQKINDRSDIWHEQLKSMSIIFGKYYVPVM